MEYIKIDEEVLECLKELTDVAERILGRMPRIENREAAPVYFFLHFFLRRVVNIGRSIVLLIENGLFEDALAIARIATEGLYYLQAFENDPSLANKWISFYVLSKYREEYDWYGKEAADKLLDGFAPDIVKKAKDEFADAFENLEKKRPRWHKFPHTFALVEHLSEEEIGEEDYEMFYGTFSEAVHWAPLGLIDAKMWLGGVIGKVFTFVLKMSITVNSRSHLGFEHELEHQQLRFIGCLRRSASGTH